MWSVSTLPKDSVSSAGFGLGVLVRVVGKLPMVRVLPGLVLAQRDGGRDMGMGAALWGRARPESVARGAGGLAGPPCVSCGRPRRPVPRQPAARRPARGGTHPPG